MRVDERPHAGILLFGFYSAIFVGLLALEAPGRLQAAEVATQPTEAVVISDLLRKNELRERFLSLTTDYRSHMANELLVRSSQASGDSRNLWQSEFVKEFTLPLRLENRFPSFRPLRLTASLDGVELGAFDIPGSQSPDEPKWYNLKMINVPTGERLIKIEVSGAQGPWIVPGNEDRGSLSRAESFEVVFVKGAKALHPVALYLEHSLNAPQLRLQAEIYGDIEP